MLAHADDSHANGAGQFGQRTPDAAQADNRHDSATEFARTRPGIPQLLLRPMLLLLVAHGLRKAFGEREGQRQRVLGNHRAVYVARVGDSDVAGAQLVAHQRVDCRRRRVNPLQLPGGFDLRAAQRPRHGDVGVGDLVGHVIVVGEMNDLDPGEVLP